MTEEQRDPVEGAGEGPEEARAEPPAGEGGPSAGEDEAAAAEEKLRRQLEEEVRNLRVQDVVLQSVVSLINLSARRIAKEDERDLDQARVGIEAVRALVDLLEGEAAQQVRNALSEVQVLFAKHAGEGAQRPGREAESPPEEEPGPRRRDRRLWTPPGT